MQLKNWHGETLVQKMSTKSFSFQKQVNLNLKNLLSIMEYQLKLVHIWKSIFVAMLVMLNNSTQSTILIQHTIPHLRTWKFKKCVISNQSKQVLLPLVQQMLMWMHTLYILIVALQVCMQVPLVLKLARKKNTNQTNQL